MSERILTMDGNEAAADVAFRLNEVIAIYPITPASPMGEFADAWSAAGRRNVFGTVPTVVEMQSEGGAAGALHGALQAGSLATTFTSSQGLLLMIPNMYKIAGELTPCVIHVAARTLATHALSIFGDHSDVMAARQTGFALLASSNVQEAMDMALVAQAASLASRVPFLHFFDGFRTSHEVGKVQVLDDDALRAMMDPELLTAHHCRGLDPEHPVIRGTAQNPDVFFQCREACNPYYDACIAHVETALDRLAGLTGRRYRTVEYHGSPDPERVIVLMGSGAETVLETLDHLLAAGEKVGALKVRLFRPFPVEALLAALPPGVRSVAVLDRTKEPGAPAEPLALDVTHALMSRPGPEPVPRLIAGRYGLSSKEFTPSMVKAVFDELAAPEPRRVFTVGIRDDVTRLSLDHDPSFHLENERTFRGIFWGLGSDGTVGANKNSIKIIGENTGHHVQGYFVYDSKKSGSVTVSHLRFGPDPIRSTYLIESANFIACHQFGFLSRYDVLEKAASGGTLLLNAPYPPAELWSYLPTDVQERILELGLTVQTIDAYEVAQRAGLGRRINTIMQVCFFALSDILPIETAIETIKTSIEKSYGRQGPAVIQQNFQAVDEALAHLHPAPAGSRVNGVERPAAVPEAAPDFVKRVTSVILSGHGDRLPVSAFTPDGTWPTATSRWEKRDIATEIPIWDQELCIQCNKCVLFCPHAAIRVQVYEPDAAEQAPAGFRTVALRERTSRPLAYTIQVAPEDCTGCSVCVDVCPAIDRKDRSRKALVMSSHDDHIETERRSFDFFSGLIPVRDPALGHESLKGSQLLEPLFEFSGACSGCGETPYVKLMSQLFGDRLLVANATGCSSIYGGNLPTTPWTVNREGRGPAWANSLFEDNAEFGLGFRIAYESRRDRARMLLARMGEDIGPDLARAILDHPQASDADVARLRERIDSIRQRLGTPVAPRYEELARRLDDLVEKHVWIVGGDGWAYDIGYGGLDHVLASGRDVNVLVLDTMVYSNTGGQMSKATPLGAVAKFAAAGKETPRKSLAMLALTYGNVYVAQVAMGAKDSQTLKAFQEAARYPGPSLIVAYSQCIAHGIEMATGMQHQKGAVECGLWPLFRYDPGAAGGTQGLKLDSRKPRVAFEEFARTESRFRSLERTDPGRARDLMRVAQKEISRQWDVLENMARLGATGSPDSAAP